MALNAASAAREAGTVGFAQGLNGAAESTVASAVGDSATLTAARSLAQTAISESALQSFGTTIGNFLSGRRLQQARPLTSVPVMCPKGEQPANLAQMAGLTPQRANVTHVRSIPCPALATNDCTLFRSRHLPQPLITAHFLPARRHPREGGKAEQGLSLAC